MTLNSYLNFNGNTREAFNFYADLFGGKIQAMMKYGDAPPGMCDGMPPESRELIMHACLMIGDQALMAGDATAMYPYKAMTGAHVVAQIDEPAEADRVFKALADRGKVEMDIQETFWAKRYGIATDRFGVQWMVNCPNPDFVAST